MTIPSQPPIGIVTPYLGGLVPYDFRLALFWREKGSKYAALKRTWKGEINTNTDKSVVRKHKGDDG